MKDNVVEGGETKEMRGQGVGWIISEDLNVPKNNDEEY